MSAEERTATLEHSDVVLHNTHAPGECRGEFCTIHNRSDHHMRAFRQHWRDDRALMERICPHGIGHPDPDAMLRAGEGVHGCDGCCVVTEPHEITVHRNASFTELGAAVDQARAGFDPQMSVSRNGHIHITFRRPVAR